MKSPEKYLPARVIAGTAIVVVIVSVMFVILVPTVGEEKAGERIAAFFDRLAKEFS